MKQRDLFKLILLVIITFILISLRYEYKEYSILKEKKQYFEDLSDIQTKDISSITVSNDLNNIKNLETTSEEYQLICQFINNIDLYSIIKLDIDRKIPTINDVNTVIDYNIIIKTNLQKPFNTIEMKFSSDNVNLIGYFNKNDKFDVINITDEGSQIIISLLSKLDKILTNHNN